MEYSQQLQQLQLLPPSPGGGGYYRLLQNCLVIVRRKSDGRAHETAAMNAAAGDSLLCLSRDYSRFVFVACAESSDADPDEASRSLTALRIGQSCGDVLLSSEDAILASSTRALVGSWSWRRADSIVPGDVIVCASPALRRRFLEGASESVPHDARVSGVRITPINPFGSERWHLRVPDSRGLIVNGVVIEAAGGPAQFPEK